MAAVRVEPILFDALPADSWVKARDICRTEQGPGVLPHGKTTLYKLVKAGKAPAPRYFGAVPMWRVDDIRKYLQSLSTNASPNSPNLRRAERLRGPATGEAEKAAT